MVLDSSDLAFILSNLGGLFMAVVIAYIFKDRMKDIGREQLLRLFRNITFHFVAPSALAAPQELLDSLKAAGHHVREFASISSGLPGAAFVLWRIRSLTRPDEAR